MCRSAILSPRSFIYPYIVFPLFRVSYNFPLLHPVSRATEHGAHFDMFGQFWFTMSSLATIEDIANEAAASPAVREYLSARGIQTIGTLALLAPDEAHLVKTLVEPLFSGWKTDSNVIKLSDAEKPVAHAMILHMWHVARAQWLKSHQNCANAAQAAPTPGQTAATAPADKDKEDKIPRALPAGVWSKLLQAYNQEKLHGRERQFPVRELMGAECIIARLWHEHHRSKLYTPLHLGEILQHRSFQSNGDLNPLAKGQKKLTNLCLEDGSLVQKEESIWQPKSILAILDGIQAAKWAMILIQLGDEMGIIDYCDVMHQRARTRPQKCEQMNLYWSSCGWKIAMAMRDGESFANASKDVIKDYDKFAEHMAKEDFSPKKAGTGTKGPPASSTKGFGKNGKFRSSFRWQPYGKGKWQGSDWQRPSYDSWRQNHDQSWHKPKDRSQWDHTKPAETNRDK